MNWRQASTWTACSVVFWAATTVPWLTPNPAHSQQPIRPTAERQKASPGTIDPKTSRVYVLVGKTGLGHDHGIEGRIQSGRLSLGTDENAGEIVFDMRSFAADTAAARRYVGLDGTTGKSTADKVTANMQSSSVLDVQRFPTAKYEVDSIVEMPRRQAGEPKRFEVRGNFTLHGTTRALRLVAEQELVDGQNHLRCRFAIRQTDFGITPYSQAFGAVGVADVLTIYGDLWLAGQRESDEADSRPERVRASTVSGESAGRARK